MASSALEAGKAQYLELELKVHVLLAEFVEGHVLPAQTLARSVTNIF
jgi:hypothetical protein